LGEQKLCAQSSGPGSEKANYRSNAVPIQDILTKVFSIIVCANQNRPLLAVIFRAFGDTALFPACCAALTRTDPLIFAGIGLSLFVVICTGRLFASTAGNTRRSADGAAA
jgi:hypothetical protein